MPKLARFRVKLVNFPSEKGRFGCLLRSLHFGSNRLKRNDKSILTCCTYQNNHKILTHCYTVDNLRIANGEGNKLIELHSPHIKDFTTALDVKIVGSSYELTQFYVLYKNTPCVQIFNWNGQVVKAIIQLKLKAGISSFLIDAENNIIICDVENISDTNKPEVGIQNLYTSYVYSNDGNRQHKWVYKSKTRGGFFQSFLKPFNKKPATVSRGTKVPDVNEYAFFAMCLNSKHNVFFLYNQENSYMLRAF